MAAPILPQTASAVHQRLTSMAARRGAVGLQYLVVRDGETWFEHCHGFADAALAKPVTPRTTFNAYSITKPFTAAAVSALAASGRLDLEAPIGVAAGVEGLAAYGSVRDTLLHRAGFRNPNPLRWIHPAETHDSFDEAEFVRVQVAALQGSRRKRARSAYSNLGYLLLGLAIERAWRGQFIGAVKSLIFEPLHLGTDDQLGFAIERPELHARGHLRRFGLLNLTLGLFVDRSTIVQSVEDRWIRLRLHQVNGSAYGGLVANARGLTRFGRAVIGNGMCTLSKLGEVLLDIVPGPGRGRSLGWFSGSLGRYEWFAHAGGGLGYYGELRLYPELGAVSCLLTNGPGLSDVRCLDQIDTTWLENL
jgi:D-alanyl-D-alanine carboxypeptidase